MELFVSVTHRSVSELLVKNCCIKCLVLLLADRTAAERWTPMADPHRFRCFVGSRFTNVVFLVVFTQPSASSSTSRSDCIPPLNVDHVVYGLVLSAFTDS